MLQCPMPPTSQGTQISEKKKKAQKHSLSLAHREALTSLPPSENKERIERPHSSCSPFFTQIMFSGLKSHGWYRKLQALCNTCSHLKLGKGKTCASTHFWGTWRKEETLRRWLYPGSKKDPKNRKHECPIGESQADPTGGR